MWTFREDKRLAVSLCSLLVGNRMSYGPTEGLSIRGTRGLHRNGRIPAIQSEKEAGVWCFNLFQL